MGWETLVFALVMMVASYAITALTQNKTAKEKPKSITDFEFPQSADGQPQAVIFGDCWSPDHQILWFGNYRNSEIKQTQAKKG